MTESVKTTSAEREFAGARTDEPLEKRLARIEDIEAIKKLKARYAYYCDHGYDADGFVSLFVEDAVWESNAFGTYRGRDEIYRFISTIGKQIVWALHYMICPVVEVASDGRMAKGTWYLLELATMVGTKNPTARDAVIITGNYEDTFVKQGGEWRFKSVKVHFHQVSNLDQGWVNQPFRGE
jgi:hypothetical protein